MDLMLILLDDKLNRLGGWIRTVTFTTAFSTGCHGSETVIFNLLIISVFDEFDNEESICSYYKSNKYGLKNNFIPKIEHIHLLSSK